MPPSLENTRAGVAAAHGALDALERDLLRQLREAAKRSDRAAELTARFVGRYLGGIIEART
jgi:hypothetical protein